MKLIHASLIFTALLVSNSAVLFAPAYGPSETDNIVILAFDIHTDKNLPSWCQELSKLLKQTNTNSIIFVTGSIAEKHPECINSFHSGVDIGSQTYNFVDLTTIDSNLAYEEIKKGKDTIDNVGNLNSKLFRAPYGASDQNTHSILYNIGIWADFTNSNQSNKYHDDELIIFDSLSYSLTRNPNLPTEIVLDKPKFLTIDNTVPISEISKLLEDFKKDRILFFNASELTGIELTHREEFQV